MTWVVNVWYINAVKIIEMRFVKKLWKFLIIRELRIDFWISCISALASANSEILKRQKELHIYKKHFSPNFEWIKVQDDSKPNKLPSIFEGLAKSCLKQIQSKTRQTKFSFSAVCKKTTRMRESKNDKTKSCDNLFKTIGAKVDRNFFVKQDDYVSLFVTDDLGSKVVLYIFFRNVNFPFGFF